MGRVRTGIASGALGAASGLAGIAALSRCGGNCTSCFGCVGAGLGVALVALWHRVQRIRPPAENAGRPLDST
jgi:hypothetical protein